MVISNSKKFCFSVVSTPFSTRFLASLSRTFFSWYRSFRGFHVSPVQMQMFFYYRLFTRWVSQCRVVWAIQLTTQILDPALNCFRWVGFFDVLQRFVEQHVAGRCIGFEDDFSKIITKCSWTYWRYFLLSIAQLTASTILVVACQLFPAPLVPVGPTRWECSRAVHSIYSRSRMKCSPEINTHNISLFFDIFLVFQHVSFKF